jgi:predicted ATPase
MAYITEFSIEGLAGRDKPYNQTLSPHINVFYGLNGSGKTSLLRILNSAMSNDAELVRNVPFRKAKVKIFSVNYKKAFISTLEKKSSINRRITRTALISKRNQIVRSATSTETDITSPSNVSFATFSAKDHWIVDPPLETPVRYWVHRYLPTSRLYISPSSFIRRLASEELLSEEQLDEIYAQAVQYLWQDYHSRVISAVNKSTQDGMANILKTVLSGGKQSEDFIPPINIEVAYDRISSFLKRQGSSKILGSFPKFEQAYMENSQLQRIVVDIDKTEQEIANIMKPRNQLETLIRRLFSGNKTVSFGDRSIDVITNNNENIGIGALSSGEKQILRILIEVLLSEDCSFIIDEPEISMHIDWQRELIKTMHNLNPTLQLIIATHSPEIMADIDDTQIFRL